MIKDHLFVAYVDLNCIIEKIDEYKNNPKNSSTAKARKHIPSGFSMSTTFSFRSTENKHDVCQDKGWMKTFCESLRQYAMKIIGLRKKKNEVIKKRAAGSYKNTTVCYIYKEKMKINIWKIKNIVKSEIISLCRRIERCYA